MSLRKAKTKIGREEKSRQLLEKKVDNQSEKIRVIIKLKNKMMLTYLILELSCTIGKGEKTIRNLFELTYLKCF